MSNRVRVTLINGEDAREAMAKKHKKNTTGAAAAKSNSTSSSGGSKKRKRRHKKNTGSMSAKPNRAHRKGHRKHKRNDAGAGGGGETTGMAVLKTVGAVVAGVGLGVLGQILMGATSLTLPVQSAILIIGGLAVGGLTLLLSKGKAKRLATGLAVGPATVGLGRQVVAWGAVNPQARAMIDRMQQMLGGSSTASTAVASSSLPAPSATAPATAPATSPAGYLTGDPYWNPAMGGSMRLGQESAGPVYMGSP